MDIARNKELKAYFQEADQNLKDDRKNRFLGQKVQPGREKQLIHAMQKAGFSEWKQDPVPSIYISTQEFIQNPYHREIHLDQIHTGQFRYEQVNVRDHELFNLEAVQKDPNGCLNDYMKLRALDQPLNTGFLYEGDDCWMMDVPGEAATNDPMAQKAHGNVITFGLGIGYFLFMALLNPRVTHVTVIEKSSGAIDLFAKDLAPQFGRQTKYDVVQGDAFAWFHERRLAKYDYIYTDIWRSSEDGLPILARLLEQYCPDDSRADFWIEDSLEELVWTVNYIYWRDMYDQKRTRLSKQGEWLRKKVQRYWNDQSGTITSAGQLKHCIYDRMRLREILSIKTNG